MVNGWFVGDFEPNVLRTSEVEIGIKRFFAGEQDPVHFHKVATEISVIISGKARINGQTVGEGDIVIIDPNEVTDFRALTDVLLTAVKIPGEKNDKYLVEQDG